jgi:hypothetical protein
MATVLITLDEADRRVLVDVLLDVARGIDPIIGWDSPDNDCETDNDEPQPGWPVRADKHDYVDHPLLVLAQIICWWYTPADVHETDTGEVAVTLDDSYDIFVAKLNQIGCKYRVQSTQL